MFIIYKICSFSFDNASVDLDVHQLTNEPMDSETEHLTLIDDSKLELEDEHPAAKDRVTRMVVSLDDLNDDADYTELDMRCVHDTVHVIDSGCGEMKTLGLVEEVRELARTPRNEQRNVMCRRNQ